MKGFRLGQFIFDTWERCSALQSSQLKPSIPVKNRAVLCDHERLSKREVTQFSECGQLGCRNREMVPNVTEVRAEFVQATGYELAGSEKTAVAICGFHVLLP